MLRRLEVEDLAILERVAVEFGPGLNVLSGETGAGKSLLLDALQLALGARADPGLIRRGEPRLRVTALFDLPASGPAAAVLAGLGVAAEDGTVIVHREVSRDNRGSCRVNGQLVTAGSLREIGSALLSLLGQGEHHRFAQPAAQLDFLDAYAGARDLRRGLGAAYAGWQQAREEAAALGGDAGERRRRRELLAYAVQEIDALALSPDEEERLSARRRQLANAERLLAAAEGALGALWEGEAAARDRLGEAARDLAAIARVDPSVDEAASLLEQAAIAADEAARALRQYRDGISFEPAEAAALEDRWTAIQRCKRKYGDTVPEVLAYRERAAAEAEALDASALAAETLAGEIARRAADLGELAGRLGRRRRAAALELSREVDGALAELGMPGAHLAVELTTRADPEGVPVDGEWRACGERGCESIRLAWAANAGEAAQPLGRAASGGELARLLLCLHSLRAEGETVPSLVFDEIDAGVGGRAAAAVAQRLQALAAGRQVLCVTHLAIIAAAADRHFAIEKTESEGRTTTAVRALQEDDRTVEIARMLDGGRGSTSREHALEMMARFARPAV